MKAVTFLFFIIETGTGFAQNVGISTTSGFVPDASAALDVSYTSKGLLIPRVALTATNAAGPITSPATSLLVYNTATAGTSPNNVVPGYYYWNGTAWNMLITGTQTTNYAWALTGNAGTTAGTNFIGTTDANDFVIKTNNTEKARATSSGNFAIGSTNFNATNPEKLLVDASTTSSFNVISGKGNINNYLQLNIQNSNAGTAASSDVVATADDGNESNYYVDLGINSSANTANIYGSIHDAYLFNAGGSGNGGNFYIGTSTSGKSLGFLTGGSSVATTTNGVTAINNERLRIDGTTGNVGIGTIAPSTKLHIFGANPLTLSGVVLGTNTTADSLLTITSGLVRKLPLSAFASSSNLWSTTGNAGTTAGTNFIGTTDAIDFAFKTNSVERARISSGGSLGIGTTTPGQKLDVNGAIVSSATTYPNYAYNSANRIIFGEPNPPANETGSITQFGSGSNTRNILLAFGKTGVNASFLGNDGNQTMLGVEGTANPITFKTGLVYTAASIIGSGAEVMRITNAGSVGIGTTAPSQKLDVNGSINASGGVIATASVTTDALAGNTGTPTPGLQLGGIGSGETISSKRTTGTNQYGIDFYTASNNRMSITNTGNVGIGTNTPTSTFEVAGSVSHPITSASGNITLSAAYYTVIIPSNVTATITLPAASSCAKRIYIIVNQNVSAQTVTPSYVSFTGSAVPNVTGQSSVTIQSDGSNWQRIQ